MQIAGKTIVSHPSPNFDERDENVPIDMLVLHYTGMTTGASALDRLTETASKVSAHYLIEEDGTVFSLVAENKRAWHAGVAFWRGHTNINARSVGVEIVNPGHEFGYRPFPENQMKAVVALSKHIAETHAINPWNVVGHSDVAPSRKQDPGELFDWQRLAENGVGLWFDAPGDGAGGSGVSAPGEAQLIKLQEALGEIGYEIEADGVYDSRTSSVITAFQRHWWPQRIDGRADRETQQAIYDIRDHVRRLT
ncbi:MAG: N-acetylmuramoyl-L-alanine amidase [Proteobacteria bacterium]|nr:N-acetylmuramoyl-L-alanine amidase [Pseudomonadota bacterium]